MASINYFKLVLRNQTPLRKRYDVLVASTQQISWADLMFCVPRHQAKYRAGDRVNGLESLPLGKLGRSALGGGC